MTNTEFAAWKLVNTIVKSPTLLDKHPSIGKYTTDRYDLVFRPYDGCYELVGFVPDPRWEMVTVKRWFTLAVLSKGEVTHV